MWSNVLVFTSCVGLLFGCASQKPYMPEWKGRDISMLVEKWGQPYETFVSGNMLVYKWRKYYYGMYNEHRYCEQIIGTQSKKITYINGDENCAYLFDKK